MYGEIQSEHEKNESRRSVHLLQGKISLKYGKELGSAEVK
jgi:hypothetical protein